MRVCDVVKNAVWYDPRVNKQISSYLQNGDDLICIGMNEPRYSEKEIKAMPCEVKIADTDLRFFSEKRNIFTKIIRELTTNNHIYRLIVESGADVIHANDLNALIPAYKAAKKLKCKIIYDTHEIFLENPWIVKNKLVKFVWSCYERRLIKRVDAVVCVSNAAADYFVEKYDISRPIVVTNCISVDRLIDAAPEKAQPKQILNHGQYVAGRGYDIMIEAAPLLKEHHDLQFVLRGFGFIENQLRNRVLELNVDNVYFASPVRLEELIPYASHAYIGLAITEQISINFKLSVSNKIFEYAAAGLPVIMSDIPEHRYLNEKYRFGLILPSDTPDELVKAILKITEDEKLYRMLSENAKRLSREINWEADFKKLLNLEKELIEA